jgi:hypothetical protein
MLTNFWIEGFESSKDRIHDAETLGLGRFIMGHFFGRSVPEEPNFSDDVFHSLEEFDGEILFWYIAFFVILSWVSLSQDRHNTVRKPWFSRQGKGEFLFNLQTTNLSIDVLSRVFYLRKWKDLVSV